MPPKYNTETEGETNWEGIIKVLNIITGLIYVAVLVTLLFFWPTSSLIALVVLHVIGMVVLALHVTIDKVMSGVLSGTVGSSSLDSGLTGFFQLFAWHHIYHRRSAINYCVVIAHLFIIFMNMLGYLESTIKEMPPSTIRFGSETQLDHTRFGTDGFKQGQLPTDKTKLSLVQMAQRGFYYAEEYRGDFGANPGTTCTPNSGWRCFAVGVRIFDNEKDPAAPLAPETVSRPDPADNWYQPLPTRGYNVDLQIAAAVDVLMNGTTMSDPCLTLGGIYVQHVNGMGKTMGAFRPIIQFEAGQAPVDNLCPLAGTPAGATIGCAQMQSQNATEYLASLRTYCTRVRKDEVDGAGYKASYIPIPESTSTVDMSTGAITHTIIIMRESTTMPAAVLRVEPAKELTTAPLFSLFHTLASSGYSQSLFSGGGNVTDYQTRGVKYGSSSPSMMYAQPYAAATNLTGKSIPGGYRQVNYPALTGFYLGFLFTIPLCIEWYYVVVSIPTFELSPRLATWFVVRLPILIAAGSLGSMLYCFAQACIILAAYFHTHGTSKSTWYMGAMLTAFALNLAHFIVWVTEYQKHGHLLSFEPYMRENMSGSPVVSTGATTLFLPLMTWFLLIEPITWLVITVFRGAFIAAGTFGGMSEGKLSTFGKQYVLIKSNTV